MNKAFILFDLQNLFKKALAVAPDTHLDLLYDQKQYYPLLLTIKQILSSYRLIKNKYQAIPVFINDYGHRDRGDYKKNRYTVSGKYIFEENMKATIRKEIYDSSLSITRDIDIEEAYKEWKKYQFDKVKEFCKLFGIYTSTYEVEADEIIAFFIHQNKDNGDYFYIVSSDKDFLQLTLFNNVFLVDIRDRKKTIVHKEMWQIEDYVAQRLFGKKYIYPVPLELFVLGQAIYGDKADNVNGISGVGTKTTQEILYTLKDKKEVIKQYTIENKAQELWDLLLTNLQDKKKLYNKLNNKYDEFQNSFKEVNLLSMDTLREKIGIERMLDIQRNLQSIDKVKQMGFYELLHRNSKQYKQLIQFFKGIERPSLIKLL